MIVHSDAGLPRPPLQTSANGLKPVSDRAFEKPFPKSSRRHITVFKKNSENDSQGKVSILNGRDDFSRLAESAQAYPCVGF